MGCRPSRPSSDIDIATGEPTPTKESGKGKKELWSEEEKKEGCPYGVQHVDLQEGLPAEIQGVRYDDGGDLFRALEKIGQSDLRIVLSDQGYAVWQETPGPIHNSAVRRIQKSFEKWEKEQGAVLHGEKEADLYYTKNFKKDNKRVADYAIWGPDRLDASEEVIAVEGKAVNPHVVFQFSWGHDLKDERDAVNDMSLYSGARDYVPLLRPNVIYLIKTIRKSKICKIVYGFDVYVTRQGERIANEPTFAYHVNAGGNEDDVTIEVAADDMGLPSEVNNFSISLAEIRSSMEKYEVVFEAKPESEDED